jgi:hypothetical protein
VAPQAMWSGLVLATNDAHPSEAPAPLRQFADKLRNIFGYNQFELVGEASEKMDDPIERWLIPSKDFCLSVKTHNDPGQHYPMEVALFQNRRRLVKFETHLSSEGLLFIRGPLYAGGQLVIVLHVMDASEMPARTTKAAVAAGSLGASGVNASPSFIGAAPKEKGNAAVNSTALVPKERPIPAPAGSQSAVPADRAGGLPVQWGAEPDSKQIKP